jgi:hypothetical protein
LLIVLSRGRQFRRNDASSASPRAIRVIGLIFLFLNANLWYLVLQPNSLVGNLTWIVCDSLDAFHHGPIAASSISQHALILWTQHAWTHDWSCHRHKTKDIRIILSVDFFWTHFFKNSKLAISAVIDRHINSAELLNSRASTASFAWTSFTSKPTTRRWSVSRCRAYLTRIANGRDNNIITSIEISIYDFRSSTEAPVTNQVFVICCIPYFTHTQCSM